MSQPTATAQAPSLTASIGGVSLRKAVGSMAAFYLLALALNGAQLHQNNDYLPYGGTRTFWMAVSAPVSAVCTRLHLDVPRRWLHTHLGIPLNGPPKKRVYNFINW